MKIAIISEYNIFTTTGGTEYYVDMLLNGLCKKGHKLLLVTKGVQRDKIEKKIQHAGDFSYAVVFLPAGTNSKAEIKQEIVSTSWEQMLPELKKFEAELVHVHTLTTFFNIRHFELCVQQFPRMIFTSHIPGNFCPKGDLIKNNRRPCNGILGKQCSICLFSMGMKTGISNLVFGHYQKKLELVRFLTKSAVDIICVSAWQKDHLIYNSLPAEKVSIVRQALVTENYTPARQIAAKRKFTIGYLGRLSPEKGSSLLMDLLKNQKGNTEIAFVLGIPENSDPGEMKLLQKLIDENDIDVEIMRSVNAGNKQIFFEAIDCLLIPSFFIETGPIVLLEAVYYNKHVIAPDVGGPIEFAAEFPQVVKTYLWNNLNSVCTIIKEVQEQVAGIVENQLSCFLEKENEFISDHITIYEKILNYSPKQLDFPS